ncbi:MAG TPA: hypothetical protein VEC36_14065 [Patescibacteria group bacterium]|nr:hypothetical protein [Patescibacteria group bacterium]
MKKKFTAAFLLLAAILTSGTVLQASGRPDYPHAVTQKDTSEHMFDEIDADSDENEEDEDMSLSLSLSYPVIELSYGIQDLNLPNFSGNFSPVRMAEITFGFGSTRVSKHDTTILRHSHNYFFLSNISSGRYGAGSASVSQLNTDMWRYGFSDKSGLGYALSTESTVLLYNGGSWMWSQLNVDGEELAAIDTTAITMKDRHEINTFEGSIRFGTSAQAGIKVKVASFLAVDAGFERTLVFPRHLFWKWLGSEVVEGIGNSLISGFIRRVEATSPHAAPVIGFLLRSGFSYGFYQLRQSKMNWPFRSAAPLHYDSFKIGASLIF